MMRYRLSLRVRLVIAFLLVSLPPMLVAAELASRAVATAFEQNVRTWLRESSTFFVSDMRESEQEALGVARYVSTRPDAIEQLIAGGGLPEELMNLAKTIGLDLLALYDADERPVYISRPVTSIENLRLGANHTLARVKIGDQAFVMMFGVEPFVYKGKPYHILAGTWIDQDFLGALGALSGLELRLYYADGARFRPFFSSRPGASGSRDLDPRTAQDILAAQDSFYDPAADGGRYMAVYTPLRGVDGEIYGAVFCGLSSYSAVREWFSKTNLSLLIVLTGIFLSVAAGLAVSGQLTRPIHALLRGVQAITAGRYDQRVAVAGRGEVAELADAFNEMAAKLAKSQELEARLRRDQRLSALGEVAVGIAHEVRNPLGVIKTSAELLQKRARLAETDNKLLGYVADEVRRIDSLIRDFLEFAKPRPPVLRSVDPVRLVERAIEFCRPELQRAAVEVATEDRSAGFPIQADEDQVFQALLNLMLNAIEAMPDGGWITIGLLRAERDLSISVGDTGTGISPEVQEKIFNPFFTTKEHGSGLGLAKVYAIMASHDGAVECRSQPGAGTTFTLSFPIGGGVTTDVPHDPARRRRA
jgi:signal transduction histidine kinase